MHSKTRWRSKHHLGMRDLMTLSFMRFLPHIMGMLSIHKRESIFPVSNPCVLMPFLSFRVNAILLEVALSTSYRMQHDRSPTPSNMEGFQKMTTPFTNALADYGYDPFEQDEFDFEDCSS